MNAVSTAAQHATHKVVASVPRVTTLPQGTTMGPAVHSTVRSSSVLVIQREAASSTAVGQAASVTAQRTTGRRVSMGRIHMRRS